MGSVFNYLKLAIALIPLVIEAIRTIEEAIPGEGQGEKKLAMIRAAFQSVEGFITGLDVDRVWSMIEKMVSGFVAIFNVTGVFKSARS